MLTRALVRAGAASGYKRASTTLTQARKQQDGAQLKVVHDPAGGGLATLSKHEVRLFFIWCARDGASS